MEFTVGGTEFSTVEVKERPPDARAASRGSAKGTPSLVQPPSGAPGGGEGDDAATRATVTTVFPDTPECLQQAREALTNALALIPVEERRAHSEAARRCPRLVEIESNADRYLKFDKFNPWAAAKRIADYWEARLELFGPERAYLPLTLTGHGAMSPEDVEVFNTGHLMVLPDDTLGRPVLLHDRARLTSPKFLDPARRLRSLFYVFSVMSQRDNAQQTGFSFLVVFCDKTRQSSFDAAMSWKAITLFGVRRIIPLALTSCHHVMLSSRTALSSILPWIVRAFQKPGVHQPQSLVFHGNKPLDELHADLRKYGFHLEGLPKVPLSGLYTFGCFRKWVEDRLRLEKRIYHQWLPPPHPGETGRSEAASTSLGVSTEDNDGDDDAVRKRRAKDAAYARRKRARKRIERQVLEAEIERLATQRRSLQLTEERLEQLLRDARHVVALHREREKEEEERSRQQQRSAEALLAAALDRRALLSNDMSSSSSLPQFTFGDSALRAQEGTFLLSLMAERPESLPRPEAAFPHYQPTSIPQLPTWEHRFSPASSAYAAAPCLPTRSLTSSELLSLMSRGRDSGNESLRLRVPSATPARFTSDDERRMLQWLASPSWEGGVAIANRPQDSAHSVLRSVAVPYSHEPCPDELERMGPGHLHLSQQRDDDGRQQRLFEELYHLLSRNAVDR